MTDRARSALVMQGKGSDRAEIPTGRISPLVSVLNADKILRVHGRGVYSQH